MNKLNEAVYGCMLSIMRRGGITMPFDQMEAVKIDCDMLSSAITEAIKAEATEPARRLQKATVSAFEGMEKDIDNLDARLKVQERR